MNQVILHNVRLSSRFLVIRHLSFVIFPSIFRAPNDSERLSTCPAPWD